MIRRLGEKNGCAVMIFMPEKEDVIRLKVGDGVHSVLGPAVVTAIRYRGTDTWGAQYVGFQAQTSAGTSITGNYHVGRIQRTLAATSLFNSNELNDFEQDMRSQN